MTRYILRRLAQALLTVLGIMLITFVLFRGIAGDVSASYVSQKLGYEARQAFYEKHKLNRPALLNYHRRLELLDRTTGPHMYTVEDVNGSALAKTIGMHLAPSDGRETAELACVSNPIFALNEKTSLDDMTKGNPWRTDSARPALAITLSDGTALDVPLEGITTCGSLIGAINDHPSNNGKLRARRSPWNAAMIFDSQFFWHIHENIMFSGRSYATDQKLTTIIAERAKFSLALTVPIIALSWLIGMIISCFTAYYRDTWIDRFGVFFSVLGMCVPYLAYMLIGQWVMFKIAPQMAAGLSHPAAVYVPVFIAVIAGLGGYVRFYRTIILDQINQDYVRTARAKGVSLPSILFSHVLRNCMLPILTNIVTTIPFLIMGSLLLERFFGIPGLGDLMLTSIYSRDVPIITGLTFLTSILYVLSLLVTDILYAVFDPRIRLR